MAIPLDMASPFLGPILGMDLGPLWPISGYYYAFLGALSRYCCAFIGAYSGHGLGPIWG